MACLGRKVEYRIDGLEYALGELLSYSNVQIYAFDDAYDVTTNLDLYSDTIHYNSCVNAWMLQCIAEKKHIVDKNNINEYIGGISGMYAQYDYSNLNQYIMGVNKIRDYFDD